MFQDYKVQPATVIFDKLLRNIKPIVKDSLHKTLFDRSDKALTAVCENNYLDWDYTSSYYIQQGRSFTSHGRRTKRIHFFSIEFTQRTFQNASDRTIKALNKSYLGNTVIRPIQPPSIGQTFLKPPETMDGTKAFFPTKSEYAVEICGIPLKIEACPYISQDELVMACATASIWMSSTSLAPKIGLQSNTTSDITALALDIKKPYGPSVLARGLRLDEEERLSWKWVMTPEYGNFLTILALRRHVISLLRVDYNLY